MSDQINGDDHQPAPGDRRVHVLYDEAKAAYAQGELERAEQRCVAALEEEPDFLAALELAGVIACQRGDLEVGIERFESLTAQAPDSAGAQFNLGNALLSAGRVDEAAKPLARAAELSPDNPDVLVTLGICERRLGRPAEAERYLARALERAPKHLAALNALGAAYAEQRKFDDALRAFQRAIDIEPRSAELRHNVGRMLMKLGRYSDAADEYRMALTVDARNADARVGLATALNNLGDHEEAIHHLRRVLKYHPDHNVATYGLIDLLGRDEHLGEVTELLDRLLGDRPEDVNLLYLRARLSARQGDDESALGAIQKAESLGVPARLERRFHAEAGALYDRLGKSDRAMLALSRANYTASKEWREIASGPNAFMARVRKIAAALEAGTLKRLRGSRGETEPVFVVGFPKSGTGLLTQIMEAHSALTTRDERPALRRLAARVDEMEAGYPDALASMDDDTVAELREGYFSEHGSVDGRLVDRNPLDLVHGSLIKRLFDGAPVVFLVRDPRDVCLGCFMEPFDLNAATANFFTLESTARCYLEVMRAWQKQRDLFDLNVHEVRFEDLVERPDEVLVSLCEFLGIEQEPAMGETVSGADMGRHARSVGRWQRYRTHLEPVLPLLDPFAEDFGYPDSEEESGD